jgi:drug/metabolite transporter (DMT)-like permease
VSLKETGARLRSGARGLAGVQPGRAATAGYDAAAERRRGWLLVGTGVLVLSPDSLLVRVIDVDTATLLFLRGALSCVGYVLIAQLISGRALQRRTWALTPSEGLLAVLFMVANVLFVLSIRNTNAALALVILAAAPAFTTLIGAVAGSESTPIPTWVASWIVFAGVAAIFLADPEGGSTAGALAALGASLAIAASLVVRRSRPARILPPLALGTLLTAVISLPLASLGSVSASDLLLASILGLVVLPVSVSLIMQGPRYLPAPEVSLLTLPEAIVGPAWIWLVLGEPPTGQAVMAGALILGTLAAHAILLQRRTPE